MTEIIEYHGVKFPVRTLEFEGQQVKVGTLSLALEIQDEEKTWKDLQGQQIDEAIIFYVNDEDIVLDDNAIRKILNENIK